MRSGAGVDGVFFVELADNLVVVKPKMMVKDMYGWELARSLGTYDNFYFAFVHLCFYYVS
jgi:hypothetical protein